MGGTTRVAADACGPIKDENHQPLGLSLRDLTQGTRNRVSGAQESCVLSRDEVKKPHLSALPCTEALGPFTFNGPPC